MTTDTAPAETATEYECCLCGETFAPTTVLICMVYADGCVASGNGRHQAGR